MELLENLAYGFSVLLGLKPVLVVTVGVILGIFVGAMPGLSPSTGVALLVPFSYTMSPALALILLSSIYLAANYGGQSQPCSSILPEPPRQPLLP